MKIFVKVKLGAKEQKIKKFGKTNFEVWLKELPIKGKANKALLNLLADYFNIPISSIIILSGSRSKQKILQIDSPIKNLKNPTN